LVINFLRTYDQFVPAERSETERGVAGYPRKKIDAWKNLCFLFYILIGSVAAWAVLK
jgi:hypothetical protein